jgi:hypothetical protein
MTDNRPQWQRPYFQTVGNVLRMNVLVFYDSVEAARQTPMDWPATLPAPQLYDLTVAEQRSLFSVFLEGSIRERASDALPAANRLDTAGCVVEFDIELPDPKDLSVHAAVRDALCELGRSEQVIGAFNSESRDWLDLKTWGTDEAAGVVDWTRILFEGEDGHGFGNVLYVLGMQQFARPDLMVCGFSNDLVEWAAKVLIDAANTMAKGAVLNDGSSFLVCRIQHADNTAYERMEATVHMFVPYVNGPEVGVTNAAGCLVFSLPNAELERLRDATL